MRSQLASQLSALQAEFDAVTIRLEEESEAAQNARAQLQRLQADYQQLKSKYENELRTLTEELEDSRLHGHSNRFFFKNCVTCFRFSSAPPNAYLLRFELEIAILLTQNQHLSCALYCSLLTAQLSYGCRCADVRVERVSRSWKIWWNSCVSSWPRWKKRRSNCRSRSETFPSSTKR